MKYRQTNNKVFHDFYKTKICSLNNLNICKKGKACPFAHSMDELRDKPNLYKTKLCDAFLANGSCSRGEQCTFAHGETELRSTPDLFKTAICHLWSEGRCVAGDHCRFAHGDDDKRPAPSSHKFKRNSFKKTSPTENHDYMQSVQYSPYSYPPQSYYGYPMYAMPMMPGEMQSPYMMSQPYGFGYAVENQVHHK